MINEHNCPRCNAPFFYFTQINTRVFYCGSDTQIPSMACRYASHLQERIKRLEKACGEMVSEEDTYIRLQTWLKAKEDKP